MTERDPIHAPVVLTRREERVALELHRAIARRLVTDPDAVIDRARKNLPHLRNAVRGHLALAWVDEWEAALDGPVESLIELMLRQDDHSVDLRQVGPFLGVLSPGERLHAIQEATRGNQGAA